MHPVTGKTSKIKISTIKEATPEAHTHDAPEVEKNKTGTIVESTSAYKYNTISGTQKLHHVTTFKNIPNFPNETDKTNKTSPRLRLPCLHRPPKIYNTSVTNSKPHPM